MRSVVALILTLLLLAACGGGEPAATTVSPTTTVLSGEELYETFIPEAKQPCSTCHRLGDEDGPIAPTLKGVSTRAGERVPGMSAEEYLRQSIVDPEAYQVDDWQLVMPTVYGEALTEAEINNLIEFLLTQ